MNNDIARKVLVVGLRNAHAMERQALELMERQSGRTDDYPMVKQRVLQHLEETQTHLQRLEQALETLGEDRSMLKDLAQSTMGNLMAKAHAVMEDEIVKNSLANYAFENFEIAAYKSLLFLGQEAGVAPVIAPLKKSLEEDQSMASWVDQHLNNVIRQYLTYQEKEQRAA